MVFEKTIDLLIDIGPKIANLSRNERDRYRDKVNETYRLFDSYMNDIIDIYEISYIFQKFGQINFINQTYLFL